MEESFWIGLILFSMFLIKTGLDAVGSYKPKPKRPKMPFPMTEFKEHDE